MNNQKQKEKKKKQLMFVSWSGRCPSRSSSSSSTEILFLGGGKWGDRWKKYKNKTRNGQRMIISNSSLKVAQRFIIQIVQHQEDQQRKTRKSKMGCDRRRGIVSKWTCWLSVSRGQEEEKKKMKLRNVSNSWGIGHNGVTE